LQIIIPLAWVCQAQKALILIGQHCLLVPRPLIQGHHSHNRERPVKRKFIQVIPYQDLDFEVG